MGRKGIGGKMVKGKKGKITDGAQEEAENKRLDY